MLLLLAGCDRLKGLDDVVGDGLVGVLVSPESAVVPVGGELALTATGLYQDHHTQDLTAVVEWASDDDVVVVVSNELDEEGLARGQGLGSTTVWAALEGVTSNAVELTVTDASLLGLTVEPDPISVAEGGTVQLTAMAAWSDGSRGDAAAQVRWITDDGSVAQIASGGVLTGAGEGETAIRAVWDDVSSADVPVEVLAGSALANLRIAEVEGVTGDGVVTLSVTIENDGEAGAGGFWVDAYLDPDGEPEFGGTGDDYTLCDWVEPGGTAQVELTLYPDDGAHTVWVLADTNLYVEEEDEDDNTFSTSLSTGGDTTAGGPNLEVTYFDYIADSTDVYWYVDITNSGSEDVESFYVDLFFDQDDAPALYDDGDTFTTVDSLAAGATTYADFLEETWCYACVSWVLIDGYDYVAESDEEDNVAGPLYVWSK